MSVTVDRVHVVDTRRKQPARGRLTGLAVALYQVHHDRQLVVHAIHLELDLLGDEFPQLDRVGLLAGTQGVQQALRMEHAEAPVTGRRQCVHDLADAIGVEQGGDALHGEVSSVDAGARISSHSYRTGSSTRVSRVELSRPPTTTVASGRCVSAPTPEDSNIGTRPRIATLAVISTGRSRRTVPSVTASRTLRPLPRNSFRKLTSTMPFSMATPNTAMKPMADGTDRYCPVMNSATMPPSVANGTLARIRAAYLTELKAV